MRCLANECIVKLDHIPVVDESQRVVTIRLAKNREQQDCVGRVISSGIPDVNQGDVVFYNVKGGVPMRQGSAQYMVLAANDVLGIVEET